jgi:molybdenum cofactor biosynthesis enzyme MoaA
MNFNLFSIVAGSEACNARCPFCISKMTPPEGITLKEPVVNWRNFEIAAKLAKQNGITTAMITSKGEPTLYPGQVSKFMQRLAKYEFPIIELQTNGIPFMERPDRYDHYLKEWYGNGLTTIAISVVHYDAEKNRQIYLPYRKEYIDLPGLISNMHDYGFSVRLACIMLDRHLDSPSELERMVGFAKQNKVEQLTVRPVNAPEDSRNVEVKDWTLAHMLTTPQRKDIESYLHENGHLLQRTGYGARIYDVGGQNVCLTNSLTLDAETEDVRQLIFFPDGHLRYDWQYEGALIL